MRRNRLLRLIRDVVFVRRLEVDERTCGLDRPIRRRRTLRHPSQRLARRRRGRSGSRGCRSTVRAANSCSTQCMPPGCSMTGACGPLAEHAAADALPLLGALAAIVAVARQNPDDVIPCQRATMYCGQPDRLVFRAGRNAGIHLRIRAAADRPEQDRHIQQPGAIERGGLLIEALEEGRVDRDALVARCRPARSADRPRGAARHSWSTHCTAVNPDARGHRCSAAILRGVDSSAAFQPVSASQKNGVPSACSRNVRLDDTRIGP